MTSRLADALRAAARPTAAAASSPTSRPAIPIATRSARDPRRGGARRRGRHRGRRAVLGSARRRPGDPARQRAGAGRRHDAARLARSGPRVPRSRSTRRSCSSPTRTRSCGWTPTVFAREAKDAGVDGVLLLDYPVEEAEPLRAPLVDAGLDPIFLISPTTTDERIRAVGASSARGFLYVISRLGVTGARDALADDVGAAAGAGAGARRRCRSPWASASRARSMSPRPAGMPTRRSSAAPWSR